MVKSQVKPVQDFLQDMNEHGLVLNCLGLLGKDTATLHNFIDVIEGALRNPEWRSDAQEYRLDKGGAHLYLDYILNDPQGLRHFNDPGRSAS